VEVVVELKYCDYCDSKDNCEWVLKVAQTFLDRESEEAL